MLFPLHALVRRRRTAGTEGAGAASSEDEAERVRTAVAAARRERASKEERALAGEMRALREAIVVLLDGVRSCSGCARGRSLPHGRYDGGFCCGGRTEGVFDEDAVAALAFAGTRPRDLRTPPPSSGDAVPRGCAFRGPTGCSLEPVDRPSLCVRFVCRELEAELRSEAPGGGRWAEVRAMTTRLDVISARFSALREARRNEDADAAMTGAVEAMARDRRARK